MVAIQHDLQIGGETWGHLVSRPNGAFVDFPTTGGPSVADATEATASALQLAYVGMQMIADELTFQAQGGVSDAVSNLMYLYFGARENEPDGVKKELAAAIASVFQRCTAGIDGDKPNVEIVDCSASVSPSYAGYVRAPSLGHGHIGRVHLRVSKIMAVSDQYLLLGAPVFSALYVHEATHRYAETTDLIGQLGDKSSTGYFPIVSAESLLDKFVEEASGGAARAREVVAGAKAAAITKEQALTNADSFAWFYTGMLQGHASTLRHAKTTGGAGAALLAAARRFKAIQETCLGPLLEVAKVYEPT